jgi:hypothetical protein
VQDNNTPPTIGAPEPTSPEVTPTPDTPTPDVSVPVTETPAETPVVDSSAPTPPAPATTEGPLTETSVPLASPAIVAVTAPTVAVPGAKSHLVAILLSIFVGVFGIDRFYLGHIGLGIAKLLLSWATFGIWWLVDVILIATRKVKNVTWED